MQEIILLIPDNIKKKVIEEARKKYYNVQIKFMSLEDFIKKILFDYDDKTIYCLMKKYHFKYDVAKRYLNNLFYINDNLNNHKMKKLKEIKQYLDDNNLLVYDYFFQNYVLDKMIYIYGYNYIDKFYLNILKKFDYKIVNIKKNKYEVKNIFGANSISEEVIFVCNRISLLLKNNINIRKIKLIYSGEYDSVLARFFKLYNIPIDINKISIYSTYDCKMILNNLDNITEKLEDIKNRDIYNCIIDILNKYAFIDNKLEVRELLINDFKKTYLNINTCNVIGLNDYIEEDDYVFLLGFNQENYPKRLKDDDFFSDKEKVIIGMNTSKEINALEEESTILNILGIKNLTITYKLFDSSNIYTRCSLFKEINDLKIENNDYSNSNILNRLLLVGMLDDLVKYNVKNKDLDLLYSNYQNISFLEYDNTYQKIDSNKLYKHLNNKLSLSYTAMDSYNKCKFRYYLQYILSLNVTKNSFAIVMGNLCHYLLANMDNEDFEIELYYNKFLVSENELSDKELFFLEKIRDDMSFVIEVIKKQQNYTTFDQKIYEKRVYVNKMRNIKVVFTGIIDKILYKEEDDITYLVIIDYKTGSANINLKNIDTGIDLQLPIYLYLSSKLELKNIKIVGFYLQKLLSSSLNNDKDYFTTWESNLKLDGYSIDNEHILSKFDTTYNDSKLIKSMKTKKDGFYSYSKVVSEDEIKDLITRVDGVIDRTIDGVLCSDFTIDPKVINNKNISCEYCPYSDICYMKSKDIVYIDNKE